MFVLKTLIDKYCKLKKPLFTCFIDLQKAFDNVLHSCLFYKLKSLGINSYFYRIIENMYSSVKLCVKSGSSYTDEFPTNIGIKQGDNLSPNPFNIYVNDIPKMFTAECMPVMLDQCQLSCLMYADDIVLLSDTAAGLQSAIDRMQNYVTKIGLTVNTKKTKVLVFQKGRQAKYQTFHAGDTILETVRTYQYLGVVFAASGSWEAAKLSLYNKSLKAFYKLRKMLGQHPDPAVTLHLFDHTVKAILTYSSEIWSCVNTGRNCKNNESRIITVFQTLIQEKLNVKMCKYVLGVHSKSSNIASLGELGRYPMFVDNIIQMVKYWFRLHETNNSLLCAALNTNVEFLKSMPTSFCQTIKFILNEVGMNFVYENPKQHSVNRTVVNLKQRLNALYETHWRNSVFF